MLQIKTRDRKIKLSYTSDCTKYSNSLVIKTYWLKRKLILKNLSQKCVTLRTLTRIVGKCIMIIHEIWQLYWFLLCIEQAYSRRKRREIESLVINRMDCSIEQRCNLQGVCIQKFQWSKYIMNILIMSITQKLRTN